MEGRGCGLGMGCAVEDSAGFKFMCREAGEIDTDVDKSGGVGFSGTYYLLTMSVNRKG